MKGLFFTATDTGVGKTYVTSAVARLLRQQGHSIAVCKPVATGAAWVDGRWLADDTVQLALSAGVTPDWSSVTPWTFPEAVAPPVAARLHGVVLDLAEIAQSVRRLEQVNTTLLVEGVGGLLCPLTEHETVADLVKAVQLPLIIVARRGLGTLNHTLLTVEVAHRRGLRVAGVVINEPEPPAGLAAMTNIEELGRRLDVPLLALVPHDAAKDGTTAVASTDWRRLAG